MKFVIAAIGAASAVSLNDAPAFPTWRETFPSAAGLVQTGTSACSQAERHFGIACDDSLVQFATGMNGDEDLGQDIIMKGDKFHYQQEMAQGGVTLLPKCKWDKEGLLTNGPVGTSCRVPICNGTNGSVDAGTCRAALA